MHEELRDFVGNLVNRIVAQYGRDYRHKKILNHQPAEELWDDLSASGLVGLGTPERFGGSGQGMVGLSFVAENLARHGHLPVLLVMSPGIVGSILLKGGSASQQEAYLPGIASGKLKFAFAITEADAGSNTHRIKTVLSEGDSDSYRLNGSKCFISGVDEADYVLVVAKAAFDGGEDKLLCCIVPTDAAGVNKNRIATEVFSADSQWLLHFDDVLVKKTDVIGESNSGLKALFAGLNPERILMASFCVGIGLRALDLGTDYARNRKVWGSPIATHQAVSHPLAESKIELELAKNMTYQAAVAFDSGDNTGELANYAKFAAARAAVSAVDKALQAHGGNGFTKDYEVSELYWPARLFRTAPVSEEMILNYVSNQVLGLPRSY
ncbi:acyl-CoA dehydrogenase family protein [Corynebacterium lactis]|uniref:Acyl-CoA dehydrogenase n=1 Tax=Corynebacterium lactis RW2-5 TaxID=1408189 RepID=A0A0K2GY21_9CORY|nr:acyl-CoA dehydrogenase family protein [Corynebacterium lactis]ALA66583.1 acyl-CoA dehydrogenase [Corynebacterium lactis RW2-5]